MDNLVGIALLATVVVALVGMAHAYPLITKRKSDTYHEHGVKRAHKLAAERERQDDRRYKRLAIMRARTARDAARDAALSAGDRLWLNK